MDGNNSRKRWNDQSFPTSDLRPNESQGQSRGMSNASDRFRPAPVIASPSSSRGAESTASYPGFYPEAAASFPVGLPQAQLQYQPNYPQGQRRQQNFATYNPDLMYNVSPQAPQNTVYESAQQFQARQPTGMQMLSDVAGPYFQNDPNAANPPGLQQHASSSSSSVYQQQQSPTNRTPLLQQGFTDNLTMGGVAQPTPELLGEGDPQPRGPEMEAAYKSYQDALKEIFHNVLNIRLAEASQSLLEVSEWLLGHVGDLGLTVDDVSLHAHRVQLWGD